MRVIALLVMLAVGVIASCVVHRTREAPSASYEVATPAVVPPEAAAPVVEGDAFERIVRPLLVQKCSPCHEPGGTMYAKLPFDQAATLRAHPAGVLKRFSGAEKTAIEAWLATAPQSH
jgi:hypothetical protein